MNQVAEGQHTPGPWTVENDEACKVRDSEDGAICLVMNLRGRNGARGRRAPSTVDANARLIAFAPELLEILETICANAEFGPDLGEAWQGTVDIYKVPIEDIETARRIVAKARAW